MATQSVETRMYARRDSIVFLKTREAFGGLSNMAGGYPLVVAGVRIPSSEALYQACRFPHLPDIQKKIIGQASPMTAKMVSKPHRGESRPDWERIRVRVMRWCLHVKLAQNWARFGELLLSTDDRPIVEESRRDPFWGAQPRDEDTLIGVNVLGRLLMELRDQLRGPESESLRIVQPPHDIDGFRLLGKEISTVEASPSTSITVAQTSPLRSLSLFDTPAEPLDARPTSGASSSAYSLMTLTQAGPGPLAAVSEHTNPATRPNDGRASRSRKRQSRDAAVDNGAHEETLFGPSDDFSGSADLVVSTASLASSRADEPAIFSVRNHSTTSEQGQPPRISDDDPSQYCGYFENERREQSMFTYDRTSREGRLYVSDAGWARFFAVRDGNVPDLVLTAGEKAWLVACWKAATT